MDVAGQHVSIVALAALGIVVGFVAGVFGLGGGFILTPLLSVVLGVPLPIAVGSGLCQMVGTATVAFLRHQKLGQGEPRFDLVMMGGSLLGVAAGASVVRTLENAGDLSIAGRTVPVVSLVLYASYLVFLLGSASTLLRRGSGAEALAYVRRGPLARIELPPFVDLPAVSLSRVSTIVIAYIGLVLGFVSGLLGVGGGIALMPILIYGFGFPIKQAAGTGILMLFVTSVSGTLVHARAGNVHLGLSLVLLCGATVSAQFGAMATRRFSATALRRGLAGLIFLTALAIAWALIVRIR